ncbi:MAG: hypothetical protein ABI867_45170 [Kofleriaceae bacterium]
MVAPWPRPSYTAGGNAGQVALIALSSAKLPDPLPISRTRHGMPDHGDGPVAVELAVRDRATNGEWFADSVVAPFAGMIVEDLGAEVAAGALAADYAYVITAELDDPDDLGHIQAAWALAKCVCEEGAAVVIDVYAVCAHLGTAVAALSPERDFDVAREIGLFVDDQEDGSGAAWAIGLRKFGRPDLVVLNISPDGGPEAALVLRDVATMLAAGEIIEPGDRIGVSDGRLLVVERFDPASSAIVAVEGEALMLVDTATTVSA